MANSNLILFTDSFYPFKDSTSKINTTIANYLSEKNSLTVVCAKDIFSNHSLFSKSSHNLRIIKLPVFFANTRYVFLKLIKFVNFAFAIFIYLLLQKEPRQTYLVSTSPPLIIPVITIFLYLKSFFTRKKPQKVLLAQDIYPDIIGEIKKEKFINNVVLNSLNKIFKYSYIQFDHVIACCEPIKKKLTEKYSLPQKKVSVVNNWSLIDEEKLRTFNYPSLEKSGSINMYLIGNVGKVHIHQQTTLTLENILIKSKLIKELHMYTGGIHHLDIFNNLKYLKNVFLHNPVKANELCMVYSQPSITVVPLSRNVSKCAFPSRIATAISLGSPILLITDYMDDNYLVDYIKNHQIGLVVDLQNMDNNSDFISNTFQSNFNFYQKNCINLHFKEFLKENSLLNIYKLIESNGIK